MKLQPQIIVQIKHRQQSDLIRKLLSLAIYCLLPAKFPLMKAEN